MATAVIAGVGRILYTSHRGAAPDTPFGPGRRSLNWLTGPWRNGRYEGPTRAPIVNAAMTFGGYQPSSPLSSWKVPVGPSLPRTAIRTMARALISTGRPWGFAWPPSSVAV
jgi:hypothetical protein